MDEGMDTGDMLLSAKTDILPTDNFETLHDRLAKIGANLLVETVKGLENGTVTPIKQPQDGVTYAPIISKEMGLVDFSKTSKEIDCQIRAFTPWPSAFFFLDNARVKIFKVELGPNTDMPFGTVINNKGDLTVACKDGSSLKILEVQPEGKGRMTAAALLNGHPVDLGKKL
jgi:methionyl-tRNA formyltransferase